MRVALIQLAYGDDESVADRTARVADLVRAQGGHDLVVLPELWAPGGFDYRAWDERAEAVDGPVAQALAGRRAGRRRHPARRLDRRAAARGERGPEGQGLWNTSLVFSPDGELVATYRKIHRFGFGEGEPASWTPGTTSSSSTCPSRPAARSRVGLSTCYDLRFPELYRRLLDRGAEVFVVPAAWPPPRVAHWTLLGQARAVEDQCVVLQCNTAGTHARHEMGGAPQVVDATGKVLAAAGLDEEVLSIDIDTAATPEWRRTFPVLRRPEAPVSAGVTAPAAALPGQGPRPRARRPRLAQHRRPRRCPSPTCAAASSCSTSGPSAASTACTSSTSCGRSRSSTPTRWSSIGVHSPKFEHEADPDALAAAVERYDVHHPVLDDPELVTWKAYTARAWPTLVRHRPRGLRRRVACRARATRTASPSLVAELVEEHGPRARCSRGDAPYVPPAARRPRPALPRQGGRRCPTGRSLVADTGAPPAWSHLEAGPASTERGPAAGGDGHASTSRRACCLLPADVAAEVGYDVVVADTVNHQLKGVRLADGVGPRRSPARAQQLRERTGGGPALEQDAVDARGTSPGSATGSWIAMAGIHQLWAFRPGDTRGRHGRGRWPARPTRGSSTARRRGVVRPALRARRLRRRRPVWVADSETSALRSLTSTADGELVVETARRHRPVRLRPPRRRRRRGAAPAPARRHRAARRLGRRQRHLQRRGPPLRPATGEVSHPGHGLAEPSDAVVERRPADRRDACSSSSSPRRTG